MSLAAHDVYLFSPTAPSARACISVAVNSVLYGMCRPGTFDITRDATFKPNVDKSQ